MHGWLCSSNCATTLLLIHGRPASIDGCRLVSMSHRLSVTMCKRVDVDSFWPCAAVVIDANHDEGRHQPGKPNPSADHRTSPLAKRPSAASVSVIIRPAAPPSKSSSSTSQKKTVTLVLLSRHRHSLKRGMPRQVLLAFDNAVGGK